MAAPEKQGQDSMSKTPVEEPDMVTMAEMAAKEMPFVLECPSDITAFDEMIDLYLPPHACCLPRRSSSQITLHIIHRCDPDSVKA